MIVMALAGNPNCGKTTLFNRLTGSAQYVGNWPGATVERKEASFTLMDEECVLVDLPGTYSLAAYGIEERVTRDFITMGASDVIIVVVDATNIERGLYLAAQIMETGRPIAVAVNMADELKKRGARLDAEKLSESLGAPCALVSAKLGTGVNELLSIAYRQAKHPSAPDIIKRYDPALRRAAREIEEIEGVAPWLAIKRLEGEGGGAQARAIAARYAMAGRMDASALVASARYKFIRQATGEAITPMEPRASRADRILMGKFTGIPAFICVMLAIFYLTFGSVGKYLSGLCALGADSLSHLLRAWLGAIYAPGWLISLLTDGVIAGVGGVIVFLPQIAILFTAMSILEDTGYMARAAYLTDGALRRLGLSGRSFIPMLMGFGCTATAVVAARAVDSERDRRLTVMLAPYMSCGAKLPVYAVFASAMLGAGSTAYILFLYALGILGMVAAAAIIKRVAFPGGETPFIMELPPYRPPDVKNVARRVLRRVGDFVARAGSVIFIMSLVVWLACRVTPGFRITDDASRSLLAEIGRLLAPLFAPLGFGDWEKVMALLSGLVAKEGVIATLRVIYSVADEGGLARVVQANFSVASACSFMVFILLYPPCAATIGAMRRELGSKKLLLISLASQIVLAYVFSFVCYRVCLIV